MSNKRKVGDMLTKSVLVSVFFGILIASFLFFLSTLLGNYSGSMIIYYFILFCIGMPILFTFFNSSGVIYGIILYVYFIGLCLIYSLNDKKYRNLILGITVLLHLFSVIFVLTKMNNDFNFVIK